METNLKPVTKSMIYRLPEGGTLTKVAEYTIGSKEALVAFIMQRIFNNYNTWTYPEIIEGMREGYIRSGTWYFDHENATYASYPC